MPVNGDVADRSGGHRRIDTRDTGFMRRVSDGDYNAKCDNLHSGCSWNQEVIAGGAVISVDPTLVRCQESRVHRVPLDHVIVPGAWSCPVNVWSSGNFTLMVDPLTIVPVAVGRSKSDMSILMS